jgi:hypothetical protein
MARVRVALEPMKLRLLHVIAARACFPSVLANAVATLPLLCQLLDVAALAEVVAAPFLSLIRPSPVPRILSVVAVEEWANCG